MGVQRKRAGTRQDAHVSSLQAPPRILRYAKPLPLRRRVKRTADGRKQMYRRWLVPRNAWRWLPDHMFYVDVLKPYQHQAEKESLWGYSRSRPAEGVAQVPALLNDPLFHDPDDPAIIRFPPRKGTCRASRGAVVLVPGGNYEFLMPHEGLSIASWLAEQGISAYVLRYRLLPKYGVDDALEDLSSAVKYVRKRHGAAPLCLMGFSAGAHLCASFCSAGLGRRFREAAGVRKGSKQLSQVLLYPCLAACEWVDEEKASWWGYNWETCESLGRGEELAKYDLVNFKPVADAVPSAPTFLVHSTQDFIVHPTAHSDLYVRRVNAYFNKAGMDAKTRPPLKYLRGAFGDHGFGLLSLWSDPCLAWLRERGFRF
eukprot:TRINITY_DN17366_c0_g1_i2.p1 TRINITY_DN17366_c0_g1~~TRINITY_DN17366_c0_g1_i2.p1  ORF type:complete len:370 (-),score=53.62 TRINITY_DN17366_c0_g1_i2:31-1140(-)